ncbi:unnamed protein product [Protopolystoma xenopodis]|uniref:Uncharacterized protein n=1 Tax=Protopolystoma xenopodis TaxID=117903 RepID=A0A448WTG2_9PLAT|nr:unnamed protein product [Protopolystoma xenopodis]
MLKPAHNPKSSAYSRRQADLRVEWFTKACHLTSQLSSRMPIRLQMESRRPAETTRQLKELLALRQASKKRSSEWWTIPLEL